MARTNHKFPARVFEVLYLCGEMRLTTCMGLVTGMGLPEGLGLSRVVRMTSGGPLLVIDSSIGCTVWGGREGGGGREGEREGWIM